MKLRNLTQKALRKTSSVLLNVEQKLEPTPQDDIITLLKNADIPTPILLRTLDYLERQLTAYQEANEHEETCNA